MSPLFCLSIFSNRFCLTYIIAVIFHIKVYHCKIDKPLARLMKLKWKKTQITNIRNGSDTTTDAVAIKKIIQGLPWWFSGKESTLQCRGTHVRSLLRELRSHMPQLLSSCASTRACMPQTTEPMRPGAWASQLERSPRATTKSPHALTKIPHAATKTRHSQK